MTVWTPVPAYAAPAPRVILKQASRVMTSIPAVAVTGTLTMYSGTQRSSLRVVGACVASRARSRDPVGRGILALRVQAHFTGFSEVARTRTPVDERFIVIGDGARYRTWEQATATHHRWTLNRVTGVAGQALELCSILFMSPAGEPTNTPTRYSDSGGGSVGGTPVWHVRLSVNPPGERWTLTWSVASASARVLRFVTKVTDTHNPSGSTSTYEYSRFGGPVRISAPSG